MGFRQNVEDIAEGVAFTDGTSAEDVLDRIGSEYYEVEFKEDKRDVYTYERNIYKVSIKIELA